MSLSRFKKYILVFSMLGMAMPAHAGWWDTATSAWSSVTKTVTDTVSYGADQFTPTFVRDGYNWATNVATRAKRAVEKQWEKSPLAVLGVTAGITAAVATFLSRRGQDLPQNQNHAEGNGQGQGQVAAELQRANAFERSAHENTEKALTDLNNEFSALVVGNDKTEEVLENAQVELGELKQTYANDIGYMNSALEKATGEHASEIKDEKNRHENEIELLKDFHKDQGEKHAEEMVGLESRMADMRTSLKDKNEANQGLRRKRDTRLDEEMERIGERHREEIFRLSAGFDKSMATKEEAWERAAKYAMSSVKEENEEMRALLNETNKANEDLQNQFKELQGQLAEQKVTEKASLRVDKELANAMNSDMTPSPMPVASPTPQEVALALGLSESGNKEKEEEEEEEEQGNSDLLTSFGKSMAFASIEDLTKIQNDGKCIYANISDKNPAHRQNYIDLLKKNPERGNYLQEIVTLLEYLCAIAVSKDQGFVEGAFMIEDTDRYIYNFLMGYDGTHERTTSHLVEKFQKERPDSVVIQGIGPFSKKVTKMQGIDLVGDFAWSNPFCWSKVSPENGQKRHLFFTDLDNETLFLKPEGWGVKGTDKAMHSASYALSWTRKKTNFFKYFIGADDDDENRKERVPEDITNKFMAIALALKETDSKGEKQLENCVKAGGLAFMVEVLRHRPADKNAKNLLEEIMGKYPDADVRIGREVLISKEELASGVGIRPEDLFKQEKPSSLN